MKTVAIIYNDITNMPAIKHNQLTVEKIFDKRVEVTNYCFSDFKEDTVITADAFLISNRKLLSKVDPYISNLKNSIIMERSIQSTMLPSILNIPVGTDVLVINDSYATSKDTVYALYELGIGHLNLIPYDMDKESSGIYRHLNYAITPGETRFVPSYIKNVINFYHRMLSFPTLLRLSEILCLNSEVITRNLIQHLNSLAETNKNYHNKFLDNQLMTQLINLIVRDSASAILVVNAEFSLVYSNEQADILFHIKDFAASSRDNASRNSFQDSILNQNLVDLLKNTEANSIIELNGEHYILEKSPLLLMEEQMGYCFTFQSENYLRQMEMNLNHHLRQKGLFAKYNFTDIMYTSSVMEQTILIAKQASVTDHTVLIRGESGTGKELIAQSIHNFSRRRNYPFVAINCNTLPESLLESQLFGYEGGSFTGAKKNGKPGLFEQANQGTIFLDEIGDVSPNLQSQLLRVLQEKQIMRIGSDKIIDLDVRIIAATNQDLEKLVAEGKFRSDLFYRLNVIPVEVPPLRERPEDILPLLSVFLGDLYKEVTEKQQADILRYPWPGNVRQLESAAMYYETLHAFPRYLHDVSSQNFSEEGNPYMPTVVPSVAPTVSKVLTPAGNPGRSVSQADFPAMPPKATAKSANLSSADLEFLILSIISDHTEPFHGIGRSGLLACLKEQRINMSDGKLRQILAEFERRGFISIVRGRGGCRITPEGADYLELSDIY